MTAILAAKPFAAAIGKAVGAIEKRSGYPILACVLIEVADGRASLVATDLDVRVTTSIAAEGDAGPLCVEASRLAAVMGRLKDKGEVKLDYQPYELVISAGRSRFTLPTLDPSPFPDFTHDSELHSFTVKSAEIARVFTAMTPAIHDGDDRAYLCGIHLECGTIGKPGEAAKLVACATDGHKFYGRHIDAPGLTPAMKGVTVPTKTCGLIAKLFDGADELSIAITAGEASDRITVIGGETTLISKLVQGTYPDWRRVMPTRASTHSYDAKSLVAAIENAIAAAGSSKAKSIRLNVSDDDETEIIFRSLPGETQAEGRDACPHSSLGGSKTEEIGVSGRYLIDMVTNLDAETVELAILDAGSPIVINATTFDDRRVVIMPMRV